MKSELSLAGVKREPSLATVKRELSLLDTIGIGINGIVGSGIYLLVSRLAQVGDGASVAGVLACGVLCVLIALCFAELGSMYDESGGPYVYARDAYGKPLGFAVGWLGMAVGVLGLAAVASGFAGALARFWPGASTAKAPIACAVIILFGAINLRGVKAGGRASTALSLLKIAPLVLVAVAGLRFVPKASLSFEPHGIAQAAFLSIFMMSGFEYAAVPAGEVRDARRTVPLAVVGSVAGAAILYALLQIVSLGALPDLAAIAQPLPDVAALALGLWGATMLGIAALFSMLGFCAGVALVAPRYFMALANDGHLPGPLAQFRPAILTSTAFACGLAIVLEYTSLVDVANVVILSGYALTCLATLVLRFRMPDRPRRYQPPAFIPLLAFCASVALLVAARPGAQEWLFTLELLAFGLVVRLLVGLLSR